MMSQNEKTTNIHVIRDACTSGTRNLTDTRSLLQKFLCLFLTCVSWKIVWKKKSTCITDADCVSFVAHTVGGSARTGLLYDSSSFESQDDVRIWANLLWEYSTRYFCGWFACVFKIQTCKSPTRRTSQRCALRAPIVINELLLLLFLFFIVIRDISNTFKQERIINNNEIRRKLEQLDIYRDEQK